MDPQQRKIVKYSLLLLQTLSVLLLQLRNYTHGGSTKTNTSVKWHIIIEKLHEWENVFLKWAIPECMGRFSSVVLSGLEQGIFLGTYISALHRLNSQLDSSLKWNASCAALHLLVSYLWLTSIAMFIYIKMHSGILIHFPDTSSDMPETSLYHPDFSTSTWEAEITDMQSA